MVEMHVPIVVMDYGPWARHDQACSVCRKHKAVLDMGSGIFQPCWECQDAGWRLKKRRLPWT